MTHIYDEAAAEIFRADIDFETDTFKVLLVDTDSTADTEEVLTVSAFTDLSEADGSGYARQTLANVTVTKASASSRIEVTADASSFASLGANSSTLNNLGAVIYVVRGGDVDSSNLPLAFYDGGGFPFTPSGATIEITWDASGFVRGDIV